MSIETFIILFVCPHVLATGLYLLDWLPVDEYAMFSQAYIIFSWFYFAIFDPPEPPYL